MVKEPNSLHNHSQDRPADVLVTASTHNTAKHLALDVAVVSPDNSGDLPGSATQLFKAAKAKERQKLTSDEARLRALTPPQTPATANYEKVPLVLESTGAWGPRMQDWWESVIALYNRVEAQPGLSRRQKGLSHTWSANSFTAWWAQRLSCAYVRHLFESVEKVAARGVYSTYNTRNGG